MKKTLKKFMAMALVIASAGSAKADWNEVIGGIIGGGIGAAACRGAGANQNWSIVCGIGGALIGSNIARQMNEQDARAYNEAYNDCAAERDVNQTCSWNGNRYGSRSGVHGEITPVRRGYHRSTREECRELRSVSYYGNQREEKTSIVCRRSDGRLYNLESRDLFVNGRLVESQTNERETNVGRRRGNRPSRPSQPPVPPPAPVPVPQPMYCQGWNMNQVAYGALVYDGAGQPGVYRGYNSYQNTVAIESNGWVRTWALHQMAIQGCHLGMQTGQYVGTQNGQGVLMGIYQTGQAVVQINGWNYVLSANSIYR